MNKLVEKISIINQALERFGKPYTVKLLKSSKTNKYYAIQAVDSNGKYIDEICTFNGQALTTSIKYSLVEGLLKNYPVLDDIKQQLWNIGELYLDNSYRIEIDSCTNHLINITIKKAKHKDAFDNVEYATTMKVSTPFVPKPKDAFTDVEYATTMTVSIPFVPDSINDYTYALDRIMYVPVQTFLDAFMVDHFNGCP